MDRSRREPLLEALLATVITLLTFLIECEKTRITDPELLAQAQIYLKIADQSLETVDNLLQRSLLDLDEEPPRSHVSLN